MRVARRISTQIALIRSSLSCSDKSVIGKTMASDDKKPKPAPKNGTAVKKEAASKDEGRVNDKTTSDTDLSKAEGGEKTAKARAKNRSRKLIKITGTRFTRKRKKRSGNWITGTGVAAVRRAYRLDRALQLATALTAWVTVVERTDCDHAGLTPKDWGRSTGAGLFFAPQMAGLSLHRSSTRCRRPVDLFDP